MFDAFRAAFYVLSALVLAVGLLNLVARTGSGSGSGWWTSAS